MLTFIWWNSFRIFLEVLTIVGFGIWKGTAENFTLIGGFLAGLFCVNVIQGYFTRCVFNYSTLVRPGIKMAGQQTEGGTSVVAHAESGTAHAPWPASGKETEFEESRHTETTKADLSTAATDDQNPRMPLTTTNKRHAE
ncbi:uncharacterized protein LOC144178082 [Haemaphysalis longicornis]